MSGREGGIKRERGGGGEREGGGCDEGREKYREGLRVRERSREVG